MCTAGKTTCIKLVCNFKAPLGLRAALFMSEKTICYTIVDLSLIIWCPDKLMSEYCGVTFKAIKD